MRYVDAIEKDNTNVQYYRNRASCYCDQNSFESAITDLEKANELSGSNDPDVLYQLGLTVYQSKKYKRCC